MTDHTPGPWFLDDELPSNPYSVLARVGGEKIPISSPSDRGDARADARLIAAAPELLNYLEIINRLASPNNRTLDELCRDLSSITDLARAGIRKAQGTP